MTTLHYHLHSRHSVTPFHIYCTFRGAKRCNPWMLTSDVLHWYTARVLNKVTLYYYTARCILNSYLIISNVVLMRFCPRNMLYSSCHVTLTTLVLCRTALEISVEYTSRLWPTSGRGINNEAEEKSRGALSRMGLAYFYITTVIYDLHWRN